MLVPRYGTRSLAEVLPSVARALGDTAFENELAIPQARQVVLLVVDGLGWEQLEPHAGDLPNLGQAVLAQEPVDAAFPTTTPAGIATLTLGMPPGAHGFVGATFLLPDFDAVLSPLHWDVDPFPTAVQPEPTVFHRMRGISVHRHGPAAFANSGMTRCLLGGAEARDHEAFASNLIEPRTAHLDYVYLPTLDKLGHVHGAGTPKWLRYLHEIDDLVGELRSRVGPHGIIVVTSDHGMVTIPDDRRIDVDEAPFGSGVDILAGEPRMRHIYSSDATEVQARWATALGDRATVWTRDEAIASGVFGPVDPSLAARIGDVVAVANDDWIMSSRTVDPRASGLRGLHGGLTSAELLVPALVVPG